MRYILGIYLVIGISIQLYAQNLKLYNGSFDVFSSLEMVNPKSSYQYYENQDFERIYKGDFTCTFLSDLLNTIGEVNQNTNNKSYDVFWEEY